MNASIDGADGHLVLDNVSVHRVESDRLHLSSSGEGSKFHLVSVLGVRYLAWSQACDECLVERHPADAFLLQLQTFIS